MRSVAIYWARRDFRLTDNPALSHALAAASQGSVLLPVFILENYMCAGDPKEQFGLPQRLFLAKAVPAFAKNFRHFSIFKGNAVHVLTQLMSALSNMGFEVRIFVNDDVHPDFYRQVKEIRASGISIEVLPDQMTVSPETVTGSGGQYSVFTPFKRAVWQEFLLAPILDRADPLAVEYVNPETLVSGLSTIKPSEEGFLKEFSQSRTFTVMGTASHVFDIARLVQNDLQIDAWYSTEEQAQTQFGQFCDKGLRQYVDGRDLLAKDGMGGTSRMSLALTWGLVSARYLRKEIQKAYEEDFGNASKEAALHLRAPVQYLSELIWREFYKYLFFHNPSLMDTEFQERFRGKVQWVEEQEALQRFEAWIRGETGYPLVDAAMKQIAEMGWMHNRTRMVVSSVLTKNLGVDWRWGQEYFRAQLLDLDEASNNGGWQWGASVGADPKPIRIFNPYLQAENYDPDSAYQKRWLGEDFESRAVHPIVDHGAARNEALARYGLRYSKAGVQRTKRMF